MCRITGFWDFNYRQNYSIKDCLVAMRDCLQHGGPDSAGAYYEPQKQLALGHRRLSILDLSAAGDQPLYLDQYVIVFNGEIFNFKAIKEQLIQVGARFQSDSDTEVILHAYKHWGLEMMHHFRGFFAIVVYDTMLKKLLLIRDRMGVKPLYWYFKDGLFLFASELKAFHQHPLFDKTINKDALSLYLQQGYIQQPHCIFKYAHKLQAGAYLSLDEDAQISIKSYWSVDNLYQQSPISQASEADLTEELEAVLSESFELRMVADVPVGTFLSGGIDSSLVTALLQKKQGRQLKTFTIGFEQEAYNEAHHAREVARHLKTDHTEFICTQQDFERVIPLLADMYDEPFGDSSAIPTYLVSEMAKDHVTVSLSADGGDELFGGYTKYEITQNFYPKIKKMPAWSRKTLQSLCSGIDPLWLERNSHRIPILKNYKNISNKFPKLLNALASENSLDFFNRASSYISQDDLRKLYPHYVPRFSTNTAPKNDQMISYWGMVDIQTYLEGDILTKVDRATMAVALEGRDPFLDHKIVEFSLKLSDHHKIRQQTTKYLLRKILYKYVPQKLIERPKQGFSIPVQQWLMHSLKDSLLALSSDQDFIQCFEFNSLELQQIIQNFLKQRQYINPHFIWFLYTLYQWYLRWIKK